MQPGNEHSVHEVLGRPPREVLVELEHHQHLDPESADEVRLALQRGEQRRLFPWGQDLARVTVERDCHWAKAAFSAHVHRPAQHRLMPSVHAVEEPDGHPGSAFAERKAPHASSDLHERAAYGGPGGSSNGQPAERTTSGTAFAPWSRY